MVDAVGSASTTGKSAVVKVIDTDGNKSNAMAVVIVGADGNLTNPAAPVLGAGTNHIGQVGSPADVITISPTLDTNAYGAGDVLFATTAVAGALRVSGGRAMLQSVCIVDVDDQKLGMTLVFLGANTALGAFNDPPDIDDTEALDLLGTVAVAAGDYVDLGGAAVATIRNIGLLVEAASGTSIWIAAVTGGTPTHTATGLRVKLGFLQA